MSIQSELQAAFEKRAAEIDARAAIIQAAADKKQENITSAASAFEEAFSRLEDDRDL